MKSGILTIFEKKFLTAYSAAILALTAVGIVCISRLYRTGVAELFAPC
ncbi:hypothetical protein [Geobacter sp. FeAm09]|nr:hypothetical protein [Geobacter sp. FeAm09]